jgi:hypothetical protein
MRSGTCPQVRIQRSGVWSTMAAASGEATRASPVRRQGPSGRPSVVAGNTSRPDADTARATGGSWRMASEAANRRSEATVAAQTSSGSASHAPGDG